MMMPSHESSGTFLKVLTIVIAGVLAWAHESLRPPKPKIIGSPGGPPITAPPMVELRDGSNLAYKEHGKPRGLANYKIIFLHDFQGCRHVAVVADNLSKELIDELGIYVVSFDRPGYGKSEPDPRRTPKSIGLDIEELANKLKLGSRFYVIGLSMGGQAVWGCLKYIPHSRELLVAFVPTDLSMEAYYRQLPQYQWAVRVAHYAPWLTYWWNTQKWFPPSSAIARKPMVFSAPDRAILAKSPSKTDHNAQVRQQGVSLHCELMVGFGTCQFDPMDLENSFPDGEGSVYLWQGDNDSVVPVTLQQYIARRLLWIKYQELAETGHLFPAVTGCPIRS